MQIRIRKSQDEDNISIGNLIKEVLGYKDLDFEKLFNRLQKMKSDDSHLTIVTEYEGKVIGFIGFYKGIAYNYDGEYIQILALAVSKKHQNKGIGSQLLKWVEDYAIEHGIQSFGVNSGLHRAEAHRFYENNGYLKKSYGFIKDI